MTENMNWKPVSRKEDLPEDNTGLWLVSFHYKSIRPTIAIKLTKSPAGWWNYSQVDQETFAIMEVPAGYTPPEPPNPIEETLRKQSYEIDMLQMGLNRRIDEIDERIDALRDFMGKKHQELENRIQDRANRLSDRLDRVENEVSDLESGLATVERKIQ